MTYEDEYPYQAKRRVTALIASLQTLIKRDPEQEVQAIALPVLDAALTDVKQAMPDDPVVQSLVDLFSRRTSLEPVSRSVRPTCSWWSSNLMQPWATPCRGSPSR